MTNPDVVNNEAEQQYEAVVEGALAVAQYTRRGDEILFHHTEVPLVLRNRGVGSALVRAALDDARARGLKVRSTCWFVSAYLRSHPEYQPLLAPGSQTSPTQA
jgi:predicted GNAT family acetyltransferase